MPLRLNSHRFRSILYLSLSPIPKSQCYLHPSPLTLNFFSTASNHKAFTVPYLINKFGFSPEFALKTSKRVNFDNPKKPDSAIAFFKTNGFSDTQINSVMRRVPALLIRDPIKKVLPKFQFLISKGASPSDVVASVSRSPSFLCRSLDNHIIPFFELLRRFTPSDEIAIAFVIATPGLISLARVQHNVNMLIDEGVTHSNIYHLFRTRPTVLCSNDLGKVVDEVKKLGFDPSKSSFSVAILAKKAVSQAQWDAKIDAFKAWGWSEQEVLEAFKRLPQFMLRSPDKLNAVIRFWVGQLGWDPSTLRRAPAIFGYSLEKRLIPRAYVVKELLSKGLMRENANLVRPFALSEHMFLEKFVRCFDEEDASGLSKLYQKELQQLSVG